MWGWRLSIAITNLEFQEVVAAGWGLTSPGSLPSKVLNRVTLKVIDDTDCHDKLDLNVRQWFHPGKTFCTWRKGKDTCGG